MSGQVGVQLTCEQVAELAGVYVLGALTATEADSVRRHVATCPDQHAEIVELGGVLPALAAAIEPRPAPASLKRRVMADWRTAHSQPRGHLLSRWAGWSTAAAVVLIVAVVGVWALGAWSETQRMQQRANDMSDAIAAMSSPESDVAMLHGMDGTADASGFAAFPSSGGGYVVIVGLQPPPTGMTYQAWYMGGGHAQSAGMASVGDDGYLLLSDMQPMDGMDTVAVTMEPDGGSPEPTGEPVVMGTLGDHG